MKKHSKLFIRLCCVISLIATSAYAELPSLRIGVLKSGSVNWEMQTLKRFQIDKKNNINIKLVELASVKGLLLALQGKSVDIIVGDWLWVAKQHQKKRNFLFYPYSTAVGAVLVNQDSSTKNLMDLKDKKIGIAGGPAGKNWLIFKAYAQNKFGLDVSKDMQVKFLAPPLLNVLLKRQEFDAGLNFWHFNAALKEDGYKQIISVDEMLAELGVNSPTPMLGWIFPKKWALSHKELVNRFLQSSIETRLKMKSSKEIWAQLKPFMKVKSDSLLERIRVIYTNNIVESLRPEYIKNIQSVYQILQKQTGATPIILPNDIFWHGLKQ